MKKTKLFALALLALGVSLNLTSCNDDDDNTKGSLREDASIITTDDYKQWVVTYANNYTYSYDNNGQCIKIGYGSEYWDLSDPKNPKLYKLCNDDNDDRYTYDCKFSYNSSGYISKMSIYESYTYGTYGETYDRSISFSYNSDDQITKISASESDTYDDSYGSTEDFEETTTFSYVDGNLTNVYISASYDSDFYEDGHLYTGTTKVEETYTFEYGDEENKYWQNIQFSDRDWRLLIYTSPEYIRIFAPIGWLGKGSKNLPVSYSYTYTKNGSVTENGPYEINYSLNENGLYADWEYEEFK